MRRSRASIFWIWGRNPLKSSSCLRASWSRVEVSRWKSLQKRAVESDSSWRESMVEWSADSFSRRL